jgi:hypothetical protein
MDFFTEFLEAMDINGDDYCIFVDIRYRADTTPTFVITFNRGTLNAFSVTSTPTTLGWSHAIGITDPVESNKIKAGINTISVEFTGPATLTYVCIDMIEVFIEYKFEY